MAQLRKIMCQPGICQFPHRNPPANMTVYRSKQKKPLIPAFVATRLREHKA